MTSKKYMLSGSDMLLILKDEFNDADYVNSELANEFHYGLFTRKKFVPGFKKRELKRFYSFLQDIIAIHDFKKVEELRYFLEDTCNRTQKFIELYKKADILEKIEIEQKITRLYEIELQASECIPRKSFFREFVEDVPNQSSPKKLQQRKKERHRKAKETEKEHNMLQSFT